MADNNVSDVNAQGMSVEDQKRRRFLTGITAGFGAIGVGAAAVPFVMSMSPSERAKNAGAPVSFDFSKVQLGQMVKVEWRGKPVVLLKRTEEMMNGLSLIADQLADPDSNASSQPEYAKNSSRSVAGYESLLVMEGVCTHLGCVPLGNGAGDFGGWFCPCHGSHYDTAGRIRKGPAPENLHIPIMSVADELVLTLG